MNGFVRLEILFGLTIDLFRKTFEAMGSSSPFQILILIKHPETRHLVLTRCSLSVS